MALWTEAMNKSGVSTSLSFPKMRKLDEVQEVLNLGKPMVYALVRSDELNAAQFGPRGVWKVRKDDLAAGQFSEGDDAPDED